MQKSTKSTFRAYARAKEAGVHIWTDGGKLQFRAPPGSMTDELRALLGEHRAELVDLLDGSGRPRRFPLTVNQEAIWAQQQLAPGMAAYHVAFALELSEAIPAEVLDRALHELLRRHRVLRLRVHTEGGDLVHVEADPDELFASACCRIERLAQDDRGAVDRAIA